MLLKAPSSLSLFNNHGDHSLNYGAFSSSSVLRYSPVKDGNGFSFSVCAAKQSNNRPLTGVLFEPFEEVKKELMLVPSVPQDSLARQKYSNESEASINEQIK